MTLWAILQGALEKYLDDIDVAAELTITDPKALFGISAERDDDEDIDDILDIDAQGNARIAITGVLTPDGPSPIAKFFGVKGTSYKAIVGAVAKATSLQAKNLTLDVDSPGGSILGLDGAWQAVRDFPGPKAAVNRGTMASAAYALGSAVGPGNLFSASAFNQVGSIGVMAEVVDDSERAKSAGIKRRTFVSKNAPLKNADPATKEGAEALQGMIDANERIFHARIAEGRGVSAEYIAEHYGRGDVLVSEDPDSSKPSAKSQGMIDKILPKGVPALTGQMWSELNQVTVAASAAESHSEETMDLKEFLGSNPDAQAAYNQAIASARAEGETAFKVTAERIGKILASDAYKSNTIIQAKGVEALSGKMSVETFETIVASVDAVIEANKLSLEANGPSSKETAAQLQAVKDDLETRAKALKIDIDQIKAAAAANKMDFATALKGEVELRELAAKDAQ